MDTPGLPQSSLLYILQRHLANQPEALVTCEWSEPLKPSCSTGP